MTMDLNELADRVEALTGPDRETDAIIWLAVTPGATRKTTVIPESEQRKGWVIDETREAGGKLIIVPAYTGIIDAAMTLVPDGCGLNLDRYWLGNRDAPAWRCDLSFGGIPSNPRRVISAEDAHSAATAITAAALRTKALSGDAR